MCLVGGFAVVAHGSGEHLSGWRSDGVFHEAFQVLDRRGQQEFVLGAAQAAKPQPDQRVNVFCLAKQPFDPLALAVGGRTSLGPRQSAGVVAGFLIPAPSRDGGDPETWWCG